MRTARVTPFAISQALTPPLRRRGKKIEPWARNVIGARLPRARISLLRDLCLGRWHLVFISADLSAPRATSRIRSPRTFSFRFHRLMTRPRSDFNDNFASFHLGLLNRAAHYPPTYNVPPGIDSSAIRSPRLINRDNERFLRSLRSRIATPFTKREIDRSYRAICRIIIARISRYAC